jgi:hypothetical protein
MEISMDLPVASLTSPAFFRPAPKFGAGYMDVVQRLKFPNNSKYGNH